MGVWGELGTMASVNLGFRAFGVAMGGVVLHLKILCEVGYLLLCQCQTCSPAMTRMTLGDDLFISPWAVVLYR